MNPNHPSESEPQPDLFEGEFPSPAPFRLEDGRDELNLAEFPLAALTNRATNGQKTLEFRDTIFDRQANQLVERKLTVTAADKFGLPQAIDDEIILGLIQLSKQQGFASKTVSFSRYEIIRMLGWKNQTWNYHRILQALDRWTGVTLKYENAWWDPVRKAWANETFHIVERLTTIQDADGKERAAFVWSDIVFNNLRKGHLKPLDLNIYRQLNNPVAKRLYRLLDKRFYHRRKVEFDLVELAFHKLGITVTNMTGEIKRRLQPAIEELEAAGVIKPMEPSRRYEKHGVKVWQVIFEKGDGVCRTEPEALPPAPEEPASEVEALLMAEGVSAKKARRLAATMPEDYLRLKMDEFRYFLTQNQGKLTNPAGYLVRSIEENYTAPKDYKSPEDREKEAAEREARKKATQKRKEAEEARRKGKEAEERQKATERSRRAQEYLSGLPEEERKGLIENITRTQKSQGFFPTSPNLAEFMINLAIEDHVINLLDGKTDTVTV